MRMEDAQKILSESSGSHTYSIRIPSLGREVSFRSMTTGHQKSLSKASLDSDNNVFLKMLLALVKELAIEDLDVESFTEIDRLAALMCIKANNSIGTSKYDITCRHCGRSFVYELDLRSKADNLGKKELPSGELKTKFDGVEYEISLRYPSVSRNYELKLMMDRVKEGLGEDASDSERDAVDLYFYKFNELNYVDGVKINGEEIEDLPTANIETREVFFDSLPASVLEELKEEVLEMAAKTSDGIVDVIKCPGCKEDLIFLMDPKDFFLT